ncbi:MAG: holo-ACP synthase [Treponema sp.]|nr:holo-ACP synthase [Candidatus Treponema equifaecale]
MIYGIGTDISKVSRFERWVKDPQMLNRFFNSCEQIENIKDKNLNFLCEHYAARFSAKEAFVKALGTGFVGIELNDFGIKKNAEGRPEFYFGEKTKKIIDSRCGLNWNIHVSLSHEKEFAVAYAVIEVNNA